MPWLWFEANSRLLRGRASTLVEKEINHGPALTPESALCHVSHDLSR
jgi:hypothetical protein